MTVPIALGAGVLVWLLVMVLPCFGLLFGLLSFVALCLGATVWASLFPLQAAGAAGSVISESPRSRYVTIAVYTLLGPALLVVLACGADHALRRFKSTVRPNVPNPKLEKANEVASLFRSSFPTLQ